MSQSSPSPYAPPAGGGVAPRPPPSPGVAMVFSALCALGLGQVYAGRLRRGLAFFGVPFVMIPAFALITHAGRLVGWGIALLLTAYVGIWIFGIVDAGRVARGANGPRAPIGQVLMLWALAAIMAPTLAVLERRFVVEAFKIPSGSMIPSLLVGDHIFVDKTVAAARGDMVVFPFPEHPNQDFVKRVIGLPGERIEFRDGGHPIINGQPLPSCRVGVFRYDDPDGTVAHHEGDLFLEVAGDKAYLAFYDHDAFPQSAQGPFTVKPGEAFMVGDNRGNAYDSRMWFGGQGGGAPMDSLKGVAFVVWISSGEGGIDPSRTGMSLTEPHLPRGAESLQPELDRCLQQLHPGPH